MKDGAGRHSRGVKDVREEEEEEEEETDVNQTEGGRTGTQCQETNHVN